MNKSIGDETDLDIMFARQAIYTKNRDVMYYELLFRTKDNVYDPSITDEQATFQVVLNNYANVIKKGVESAVPCFIKVTDDLLLNNTLPELPRGKYVLSLMGRSKITPELIAKLKELGKQGVRLALSDYDPTERRFDPLLNIVHILKLDIKLLGLDNLPKLIQRLRPFQLELLADKVETKEQFVKCLEMGFSLYQGYFLGQPSSVKGKKVAANKLVLLQMLAEIDREGSDAKSVEAIALNDPSLTYKILRVVNSSAFSSPKQIVSLSHAISLLGMAQIKRWVVIFMTASDEKAKQDLVMTMLIRGRMAELLAEMLGYDDPIGCFMMGLLSKLDVLLNIEMSELMQQMPLAIEIQEAILNHKGEMGAILQDIKHYQKGEFDSVQGDLGSAMYQVAFRHSVKWAEQVMKSV